MNDLITWLRAQLDHDEEKWREKLLHSGDPRRAFALADIDAKRRILDWIEMQQSPNSTIGDDFVFPAFALALPYADREGYREEWRP